MSHQCRPTCAPCVRKAAQVLGEIRADLLPGLTRTVPITRTTDPKEGTREPAAA